MADSDPNVVTNTTTTTQQTIVLPSASTRRNIVIVTLLMMWAMIWYIIAFGSPANSLHQSALSWAFITSVGVIFAYVFGAIVDNWGMWKNVTPPSK